MSVALKMTEEDAPAQNSEAKTIPCLKCGKPFKSAHKFNRMCRKCKNKHNSSEWDTWGGKVMYDDS